MILNRTKIKSLVLTVFVAGMSLTSSCSTVEPDVKPIAVDDSGADRVLLYYAAGFNDLSSYLKDDIEEMCTLGFVPSEKSKAVLLIFSNLVKHGYNTPVSPSLTKVYRNFRGEVVRDTLMKLDAGTLAANANTLRLVLDKVREMYPAKECGMIFSSHATGWIPATNTFPLKKNDISTSSIGSEFEPGNRISYEMNLTDFAAAINKPLDFILFDSCFMGAAEVAHELRNKCLNTVFSQTEVLADGFDYTIMTEYLLKPDVANLRGVCEAFFSHYDSMEGDYRSATVSMVDCSKMDDLAAVCKEIYSSHRSSLNSLIPEDIQCFGRIGSHRYFYDLEDIVKHLNISEDEYSIFKKALDRCIIYKAATESFIELPIKEFCGLSSYMTNKVKYDPFYKTLSWNKATGMIK